MTFGQFLLKAHQPEFWNSVRKLNCVITEYSPLFFSSVLHALKSGNKALVVCDIATHERAALEGALSMSFLGGSSTYVIYAGAESNGKFDTQFLDFLKMYTGPHRVIVFTKPDQALPESKPAQGDAALSTPRVTIPESVDRATYAALYTFLRAGEVGDPKFIQQLFGRAELGASATVPLERACVLISYQAVLGKNHEQFFTQWFDKICEPKRSLFTMSQYLFAQDKARFYALWLPIKDDYAQEFWVAFFAEQIWQALSFVAARQAGAQPQQGNRLPFSFAQRDWKRHTVPHLSQAFDLLYRIDHSNKNGALNEGFDLVFAKLLG